MAPSCWSSPRRQKNTALSYIAVNKGLASSARLVLGLGVGGMAATAFTLVASFAFLTLFAASMYSRSRVVASFPCRFLSVVQRSRWS